MHLRRPLALTAGALVLSLGGLTSCGFELMTDQPYTPGAGTNDRDGQVDVLAAVIVAAQPNEGTFVATFANNSADQAALNGVAGADLDVDEFEPVEIDPRGAVNLAEEGGILVSGDFDAGQLIPITFSFEAGDTATLNVPVVTACDTYLGLDLTEDSENIPYACDAEPEPVGGE